MQAVLKPRSHFHNCKARRGATGGGGGGWQSDFFFFVVACQLSGRGHDHADNTPSTL